MNPATIRALLIEDSLGDALMVMQRLARGNGPRVEVERVRTLQHGFDFLAKARTDVVLLDLHLPDSSGTETVRRVREAVSAPADRGVLERRRPGASDPLDPCRRAGLLGKNDFESEPLLGRILTSIERMQIQERQQRVQNQLEETERMQSLGVLGAGAALGFNQLIGTILDHTDEAIAGLADTSTSTSTRLHLLEARKAALRAIDLAVQLRDYARADRATMRPIDLTEFVLGERAHLEAIAGPAIDLELDLETPGPTVLGNPLELRQLLFNLVINAGEAIRPTAGRICVRTSSVWADAELIKSGQGTPDMAEGLYTMLSVSDTGAGIDAKHAGALVRPVLHHQVRRARSRTCVCARRGAPALRVDRRGQRPLRPRRALPGDAAVGEVGLARRHRRASAAAAASG